MHVAQRQMPYELTQYVLSRRPDYVIVFPTWFPRLTARTDLLEPLGSIGAGLRFSLLGILVLRYDFGKRIERNFTRFQSDVFQQFFFGWDF